MWAIVKQRSYGLLILAGVLWLAHLLNVFFFSNQLYQWGVLPRHIQTLPHVFSMPFIHGSFTHLIGNTFPFLVFSWICLVRGWAYYAFASLVIIAVGGLGVWLFAREAWHIGASGWVFGLWGLIVSRALFEKHIKTILLAMLMLLLYGGMLYGVLPTESGVSFEGHLFGLLAGVLAAWLSSKVFKSS